MNLPRNSSNSFRILLPVANPKHAAGLGTLAATIAKAHNGEVQVLRVLSYYRQSGERSDPSIENARQAIEALGVRVSDASIVNEDVGRAIRNFALDHKANVVLLGWHGIGGDTSGGRIGVTLDPVLEDPPCEIFVLIGEVTAAWRRILVPIAGGPNATLALHTALALSDQLDAEVTALYVAPPAPNSDQSDKAAQQNIRAQAEVDLRTYVGESAGHPRLNSKIALHANPVTAILDEVAGRHEVILIGASRENILDLALFGSVPLQLAQAGHVPVLVAKQPRSAVTGSLLSIWRRVYGLLPKNTVREQAEIFEEVEQGAHPRVDFFVMIGLAAAIATFGLLLNSPAVIIGAMLVAPLMSAIIGLGLGIIEGNATLVRTAAAASFRGLLLAIAVGFIVALIVPDPHPTAEIMSRTQPTLLDLGVAIASGLAGAYAIARKGVASALPGVAVAVALVPPLATVGIGLALGDLLIAAGAFLLFITNFTAIVVMGGLAFILLGFGPTAGQRHEQAVTRRGLIWMTALLAILIIVLGILTVKSIESSQLSHSIQNAVTEEVSQLLHAEVAQQSYTQGGNQGETIELQIVVRTQKSVPYADVLSLQQSIATRLQRPVALRLSVVEATILDPLIPPTFTPTPLIEPTATTSPAPTPTSTATPLPTVSPAATPTITPIPTLTPTATPIPASVSHTGGVGLRMYDAPNGNVIAVLPEGALVAIENTLTTDQGVVWAQVHDLIGRSGWVNEKYLSAQP